jgi:hypothetical protein
MPKQKMLRFNKFNEWGLTKVNTVFWLRHSDEYELICSDTKLMNNCKIVRTSSYLVSQFLIICDPSLVI